MERIELAEFVVPWVEMQRWRRRIRKELQRLPVRLIVASPDREGPPCFRRELIYGGHFDKKPLRTPILAEVALSSALRKRLLAKEEPVAERHSITYYNNRKREKRIADTKLAYDRLHDVIPLDLTKRRCDRVKPDLIWAEVHEENKRHIVGMTVNHTYGRPNRTQIDYPDKRFAKASKTRDFYRWHGIFTHDKEKDEPTCS